MWFDKTIERRPNAFWFWYYRAELAHSMKDDATAKTKITESLRLARATKGGDYGYIAKGEMLEAKLK